MPKTIFGTTEKSNFILNMKDETIERLPLICVKMVAIVFLLGQAVPDLVEIICSLTGNGIGKAYGFLNTPFICLAIVWVVSIIMLVIMGARQRFDKKHHTMLIVLVSIFGVWSMVSAIKSFSFLDAFNGVYGRTTGVLTILSCATILILMSFNTSKENLSSMIKVLVISSAVQCGMGLIQILSCFTESEISYYENLNSISLYGVCLPSGFSGSPIFFAEYLGIMLGITLTLSCIEKSKFYAIMSIVYTYLMLDTHTVVGVLGVIVIVLAVIVITVMSKSKNFLPIVLCAITGVITVAVSFKLDGSYIFYDGSIMWQDSFNRLGTTGYYWGESANFDITNVKEVFTYIWSNTIECIKLFPIVGTGSDCLSFAQLGNAESINFVLNSFDLAYNDYLHITATMGIPAIVVYLVGLIFCFVKVVKRFNDSNTFKALLVTMIGFVFMSLVSCTSISIMPYISIILGLACSKKFTQEVESIETPIETKE